MPTEFLFLTLGIYAQYIRVIRLLKHIYLHQTSVFPLLLQTGCRFLYSSLCIESCNLYGLDLCVDLKQNNLE